MTDDNTPEFKILKVQVSEAFARDELTTAVELGIHYWARVLKVERDADSYIRRATIVDIEDDSKPLRQRRHVVTIRAMQRAIARLLCDPQATHSRGITAQLITLNVDARTADAAFQVACFGDVIYG